MLTFSGSEGTVPGATYALSISSSSQQTPTSTESEYSQVSSAVPNSPKTPTLAASAVGGAKAGRTPPSTNVISVAGGVVVGLAVFLLLMVILLWLRKRGSIRKIAPSSEFRDVVDASNHATFVRRFALAWDNRHEPEDSPPMKSEM